MITNNKFLRNTAMYDGGAIFAWMIDGYAVIKGNEFWENQVQDHGGGIFAVDRFQAEGIEICNNLFVRNRAWGLGTGDTGSGGAMWITEFSGTVCHNTIVNNFGFGETVCSGGGIAMFITPADLLIQNNILAFNNSCGITCKDDVQFTLGVNLLWENENGNMGTGAGLCTFASGDDIIIANPYFCDANNDDYTLAENSPALGMGAYPGAGCGPVPVQRTTWGQIKAKYGSGP